MMLIEKFGRVALVILLSYGFSTVDSTGNEEAATDLFNSSTSASQILSAGTANPNVSSSTSNGPPKPTTPSSPSVPSTPTQSAKSPTPSSATLPAAQPSPSVPSTPTQSAKSPTPSSATLPTAQPSPSVHSNSAELSKPSTKSTSVSSTSIGLTAVVSDDAKEQMDNATRDPLHPSKTHDDGNGATGPMDFLTYFIVVVITLVICYLLYSNRQRLKTWYNNRHLFCMKGSKGSYKRLPVIVNENELDQFKSYVY